MVCGYNFLQRITTSLLVMRCANLPRPRIERTREEPDVADQDLPDVVWDGDYEDHEWRAIAAKKEPDRSRAERLRLAQPPRRHPFQAGEVHVEEVTFPDGQARTCYFESKASAKAFKSRHESAGKKLKFRAVTETYEDAPLEPREASLAAQSVQDLAPRPDKVVASLEAPEQAGLDKRAVEADIKRRRGAQVT